MGEASTVWDVPLVIAIFVISVLIIWAGEKLRK